MNVVMPQIAPSSTPTPIASSPRTGNATPPAKFSTVLAQAQDASAPVTQQAATENSAPKAPAKGDKNPGKSSNATTRAQSAQTPALANNIVHTALTLPAIPIPVAKLALKDAPSDGDSSSEQDNALTAPVSDQAAGSDFQPQLSTALPNSAVEEPNVIKGAADFSKALAAQSELITANNPANKKADIPESEKHVQQAIATATAEPGASAAETVVKPVNIAATVPAIALDPANGKSASGSSKSPTTTSSVHSVSIPRANDQPHTELSLPPQVHATTPAPSVAVKPSTSDSDQAKSNSQASSTGDKPADATRKEATGASDAASKENSVSHNASLTGSNASPASTNLSSAVSSSSATTATTAAQVSTPAPVQTASVGVFGKSPATSAQAQSVANAEAVEAAQEAAATAAGSALHAAKLVAGLEQSELRVGLHAGEFGSVDIRTSLARNQFTAEISVERGELGRVLAAELPALQHRFAEQQLPHPNITLQQHASGESSDFRQGGRQQQNAPTNNLSGNTHEEPFLPSMMPAEILETTGLDIHM